MDPAPVVHYSPARYWMFIAAGSVIAVAALTYGVSQHQVIAAGTGILVLVFTALFWLGVREKVSGKGPALARDGDFLVGGELARPLPIAETTYEIKSDNQGSWIIVLRSGDATFRLGAGGWRVDGERFFTKAVAERVLGDLGLTRRT